MSILRDSRRHRVPVVLFSLALFLLGSNYCLLSAWGGNTRMACLSVPSASAAGCSHCGPPKHSRANDHAPTRSCCPDPMVAPSVPVLAKNITVAVTPSLPFAVLMADDLSPLPSAWHGHSPLHDGQPPTPLVRAPLSARAPPLA